MVPQAIEVRRLGKRFQYRDRWFRAHTIVALKEVSFSVAQGESFGLLGPNGSGKSTLLRILSTLLLPTEGEAWVAGEPVSRIEAIKRRIGVIPSAARGFRGLLNGRQNLEFFAVLQRLEPAAIRPRVESLLEKLGIAGLGDQPVWTYSTGQRQRLNIARALLHDPPILLLDEPTRGLDPWVAQEIRRWIREDLLLKQGKTLLVASNQVEDVRELCGRAALLVKGRMAWEGGVAREGCELSDTLQKAMAAA